MRVTAATLRDFRNFTQVEIELAPGLTVLAGPNGSGKTNLLEAVYFGCTARSPRTKTDRELVRRGAAVARVTVATRDDEGTGHLLEVGVDPGEAKSLRVDGAAREGLRRCPERPLVSVFMPERLELVKGAPAARRAHLDQLVAALWPSRAETRSAYSRTLTQRNALVARIRSGAAGADSLHTWDAELAGHGARLMADRAEAIALLATGFASRARDLGLPEPAAIAYRPRSDATDAAGLAAELAERHPADLERGFTAHGPHRDDVRLAHGDISLRTYGSQGQQRVALLALLFAERDLLTDQRGTPPLMLLDDVMSELDGARRELLAGLLREEGQGVVTTTDLDHVPGARDDDVGVIDVNAGMAGAREPSGGVAA